MFGKCYLYSNTQVRNALQTGGGLPSDVAGIHEWAQHFLKQIVL